MTVPRWPALVLVVALVVAATLVPRPDPGEPGPSRDPAADAWIAPPESASSLWFCVGGTGAEGSRAEHRVTLVNLTDQERTATVTVAGSRDGQDEQAPRPEARAREVELPPLRRTEVRSASVLEAPFVAATVEVDGGGVLVEQAVRGPGGVHRTGCASRASDRWVVPVGSTATTAEEPPVREVLVLLNPFPGDAVVDAAFSTDAGFRGTPEALRGLVVPGRSVVGVDLAASDVTVADQVASEITARSGRVVVGRIQVYADGEARRGLVLTGGVPSPASSWAFAAGALGEGRTERLVVFNPNEVPSAVDVEVRPHDPSVGVEPFQLNVRPRQHAVLDLHEEPRLADLVDRGIPYSLRVYTIDGSAVMAERLVLVEPGASGAGAAASTGSAMAATSLATNVVGTEADRGTLVLVNPSSSTLAQIELSVIAGGEREPPPRFATAELPPGGRLAIDLSELDVGSFTVLVESTSPIVGERELVGRNDRSIGAVVPVAGTTSAVTGPGG